MLAFSKSVRVEGLEPPSLAAPDPKSGVSTNFTTPAFGTAKVGDKVDKLPFGKLGMKNNWLTGEMPRNYLVEVIV